MKKSEEIIEELMETLPTRRIIKNFIEFMNNGEIYFCVDIGHNTRCMDELDDDAEDQLITKFFDINLEDLTEEEHEDLDATLEKQINDIDNQIELFEKTLDPIKSKKIRSLIADLKYKKHDLEYIQSFFVIQGDSNDKVRLLLNPDVPLSFNLCGKKHCRSLGRFNPLLKKGNNQMTEKEIVQYLKQNKENGVAFAFLPEEVKEWCKNNSSKLIYYQPNDLWNRNSAKEYLFVSIEIVALPEDFDLVPKSEGGWVEFEINDNSFICSDEKEHPKWCFDWWDWQGFLTESSNSDLDYTAFGGWQYKGCCSWFNNPQFFIDGEFRSVEFGGEPEAKPAIPTKIRFWREAK